MFYEHSIIFFHSQIKQLESELQKRGIKHTGLKNALVKRLEKNDKEMPDKQSTTEDVVNSQDNKIPPLNQCDDCDSPTTSDHTPQNFHQIHQQPAHQQHDDFLQTVTEMLVNGCKIMTMAVKCECDNIFLINKEAIIDESKIIKTNQQDFMDHMEQCFDIKRRKDVIKKLTESKQNK